MNDHTRRADLPLLAASQAQKHVTVNEALSVIDTLLHLSVLSARPHPPSSPNVDDLYLIVWPASGDWSGREGDIAVWGGMSWTYRTPCAGWLAHIEDVHVVQVFDGEAWSAIGNALGDIQGLGRLGVGGAASADAPFTAHVNTALFTPPAAPADGSTRLYVNRRADADVASVVLQTNYTTGAELALDAQGLAFKTAQDGALVTALQISGDRDVGIGTVTPKARLEVAGVLKVGDGAMADGIILGDPQVPMGVGTGVYLVRRDDSMSGPGAALHVGGFGGIHLHVGDTPAGSVGPRLSIAAGSVDTAVTLRPQIDNAVDVGSSDRRFAQIYAANSVITTSDARDKTDIEPSRLGLDLVNRLAPVSYRFIDGGWDGDQPRPGRRRHYGLIAQDVEAALEGEDFGGFVRFDNDRLGLRYEQFVPVLIQALNELTARVEGLEREVAAPASTKPVRSRKKSAERTVGDSPAPKNAGE